MPRTCTVCVHPQRDAIDAALVAGASLRGIAGQYGLTDSSVARHKATCLPATLVQAHEAKEHARGDDLLAQVKDLQRITMSLLARAVNAGDLRTAVSAVGQARGNLELLGTLLGDLQRQGTVNLVVSPEWATVRSALLVALQPYPEARVAVSDRLVALEGGAPHARAG